MGIVHNLSRASPKMYNIYRVNEHPVEFISPGIIENSDKLGSIWMAKFGGDRMSDSATSLLMEPSHFMVYLAHITSS